MVQMIHMHGTNVNYRDNLKNISIEYDSDMYLGMRLIIVMGRL